MSKLSMKPSRPTEPDPVEVDLIAAVESATGSYKAASVHLNSFETPEWRDACLTYDESKAALVEAERGLADHRRAMRAKRREERTGRPVVVPFPKGGVA